MEACSGVLHEMFPKSIMKRFPTHSPMSTSDFFDSKDSDLSIFCGTNAFRRSWRLRARKNQWALNWWQRFLLNPVVTFGVGWNSYKTGSSFLSAATYRSLLSRTGIHSVRDEFTRRNLNDVGIQNVINTGCPTLWELTEERLSRVPTRKSHSVVFTLTDYKRDVLADRALAATLLREYDEVFFWPQGSFDGEYFNSLGLDSSIKFVPYGLDSYNAMLEGDVDFIGTRLHAGIRALQRGRRSIILAIDNRAIEMGRDFNVPVVSRSDVDGLTRMIKTEWSANIQLPEENIRVWRSQFS
jgi:polysaccharide pyruvyl transferase WcaK-like protein